MIKWLKLLASSHHKDHLKLSSSIPLECKKVVYFFTGLQENSLISLCRLIVYLLLESCLKITNLYSYFHKIPKKKLETIIILKMYYWDQKNSPAGRVLALYAANLSLITGIPYNPPSLRGIISQ